MTLRRFLLGLLAIVGFCLVTVVAGALWIRAHPHVLAQMISTHLPSGAVLRELSGLKLRLTGGELDALAAEWEGTTFRVRGANWIWRIESWWPLRIAPQSIAGEELSVRLSPDKSPDPALIPRYWESDWWPTVAAIDARVKLLRVLDHTGALLVEAELDVSDGASAGQSRVMIPNLPPLAVQWAPATEGAWRIDWRSEAPMAASGTMGIRRSGNGIDWTLAARAEPLDLGGTQTRDLVVDASGSSDLFAGSEPLIRTALRIGATSGATANALAWRCEAAATVSQAREVALDIATCAGEKDKTSIAFDAPVSVRFDAARALAHVSVAAGRLRVEQLNQGAWKIPSLDATLNAATLFDATVPGWTLPALHYKTEARNAASKRVAYVEGKVSEARFLDGKSSARIDAEVTLQQGPHVIAPLTVRIAAHADATMIDAEGTVKTSAIGTLATFTGRYTRAESAYEVNATIDSAQWRWGKGLFATLLGARQTLVPAELLSGELKAAIRLRGNPQRSSVRVDATARRLFASASGSAVAGLDLAPFTVDFRNGKRKALAPLAWTIDSLNAGIVLGKLRGTLVESNAHWSLADIHGDILGGSFDIAQLTLPGTQPGAAIVVLHGIELERVAKMLDKPEIVLQGKVNGSIPLQIESAAITMRDGVVRGDGAGVIRYNAADNAGESAQLKMARKALSNLQYDSLEATLQYAPDGKLGVAAAIRGRNPDLDEKRPVHLNLTVETNLRTLLRSLRAADRVNAWLAKRIEERK
jgi:Dicarboxylate transport